MRARGNQKFGKRAKRIEGQFAPRTIEMLESPAMAVLGLSDRRVLDRLEIELAHHGGCDNGDLPCTYDDFQRFGIDRHSVAPAIRRLVALGFVEVTERGVAGNREFRRPNRYRLTFRHTTAGPTDEWRSIKTISEAVHRAKVAQAAVSEPRSRKRNSSAGKRQFSVGVSPTDGTKLEACESELSLKSASNP